MVNPGFRSFHPSREAVCSEQSRPYLAVIARKQTHPAARLFSGLLAGHFGSWPIEATACIQGKSALTLLVKPVWKHYHRHTQRYAEVIQVLLNPTRLISQINPPSWWASGTEGGGRFEKSPENIHCRGITTQWGCDGLYMGKLSHAYRETVSESEDYVWITLPLSESSTYFPRLLVWIEVGLCNSVLENIKRGSPFQQRSPLFIPCYKRACSGKGKLEVQPGELIHRQSVVSNFSWQPQPPQLVSAGCCELPIWWCYFYLCYSFIWRLYLMGHSTMSDILTGELQPAAIMGLPQWISFCCLLWATNLIMFCYLSIQPIHLLFILLLWLPIYLINIHSKSKV